MTGTASGLDIVTLSLDEYEALIERIEDAEDMLALGKSDCVNSSRNLPIEAVKRLLAGEHPVRVWREHRELTGSQLAELSGVPQSYVSEIECGRKPGSATALKRIAQVLDAPLEELIPDD